MNQFNPDFLTVEVTHRMEEMWQWAANERLARGVRAHRDQPSFAGRAASVFKRITVHWSRLRNWQRMSHAGAVAPTANLSGDARVSKLRRML